MLNCIELQRFPVCTCFGLLNLFIFIASGRHKDYHIVFVDISVSNYVGLSHFIRVQPAFQQSVMMDVLLSVASIVFSL